MKTMKLSELCTIENGTKKNTKTGNVPLYGTSGIFSKVEKPCFTWPTIVIPKRGTLKKCFFSEYGAASSTVFYTTSVREDLISLPYLYEYLNISNLETLGNNSLIKEIYLNILLNFSITFPNLEEQGIILKKINLMRDKINSLERLKEAENKKLTFFLQSLL